MGSGRSSLRNSTEGAASLFSIVDYGDEDATAQREEEEENETEQMNTEMLEKESRPAQDFEEKENFDETVREEQVDT